ncbi:glycerate kinase [Candidatus Poriferisocius sp.]|uniref:glycerate kinase family protein n=1 Tax=Candidatus Poriferisocius sp. TaxID=3101276 RepID=UPI003B5A6B6E
MHIVAAPDKFRGTATAAEVTAAIAQAARPVGATVDAAPMADGGEGTLEVLGGANRITTVTGPLGDPVAAPWRLDRRTAVIEMARASGLALVGGAESNDPLGATTYGTGELIEAALERGARRILVGVGGSATTDGGLGALRALYPTQRLKGVDLSVACDVTTRFVDAAEVFGPQKGAGPAQVELLRRRLQRLAQVYAETYGMEVSPLEGSGAAGGLAGGLACVGAELRGGFELLAEEVDLYGRIEQADLVITGEGALDATSVEGKVVGGVWEMASVAGVPVLTVVGRADPAVSSTGGPLVSLSERFGTDRAMADTTGLITQVVSDVLATL